MFKNICKFCGLLIFSSIICATEYFREVPIDSNSYFRPELINKYPNSLKSYEISENDVINYMEPNYKRFREFAEGLFDSTIKTAENFKIYIQNEENFKKLCGLVKPDSPITIDMFNPEIEELKNLKLSFINVIDDLLADYDNEDNCNYRINVCYGIAKNHLNEFNPEIDKIKIHDWRLDGYLTEASNLADFLEYYVLENGGKIHSIRINKPD